MLSIGERESVSIHVHARRVSVSVCMLWFFLCDSKCNFPQRQNVEVRARSLCAKLAHSRSMRSFMIMNASPNVILTSLIDINYKLCGSESQQDRCICMEACVGGCCLCLCVCVLYTCVW